MPDFIRYYGQFQSARGSFGSLPPWARGMVTLLAVPGVVLACLSLLLLGVSILALLVLTVPAYRLLRAVTGGSTAAEAAASPMMPESSSLFDVAPSPGRKAVQVRVVE